MCIKHFTAGKQHVTILLLLKENFISQAGICKTTTTTKLSGSQDEDDDSANSVVG